MQCGVGELLNKNLFYYNIFLYIFLRFDNFLNLYKRKLIIVVSNGLFGPVVGQSVLSQSILDHHDRDSQC